MFTSRIAIASAITRAAGSCSDRPIGKRNTRDR